MRRFARRILPHGQLGRQFVPYPVSSVPRTARCFSAGDETPVQHRIIHFQDHSGGRHFGIFADDEQTMARLVRRTDDGRVEALEDEIPIATMLAPVDPVNILCIGLNYKDHAEETGIQLPRYPVVFMKASTSVVGHECPVVIPPCATDPPEVDFEAELAVVIGRECRDVKAADALDYVLGYTIANDVTARRWQGKKGGGQWVRSKSFDTFCPMGPYLIPSSTIPDPQTLGIRTWLNGELMQDGHTSDMIFSVAQLIEFLSESTTLAPGTVILTGTPKRDDLQGVGFVRDPPVYLKAGDLVEIEIDGLGKLSNPIGVEESWGGVRMA